MKPQTQLRKEPNGSCLQSCVATLLEYKLESVPDFVLEEGEINGFPAWWWKLQEFLSTKGFFFLEIQLVPNFPWMALPLPALCILFGETQTGVKHAIVGRVEHDQFYPVFNPWPEAMLAGGVGALGFILPRDPVMPVKLGVALEKIIKLSKCCAVDGAMSGQLGTILQSVHETAQEALGLYPFNGRKVITDAFDGKS